MVSFAATSLTAEEFFNLDDRNSRVDRALELVRGVVVELPLSGKRHGLVCANVAVALGNFAARRKLGYVKKFLDFGVALVWLVDPEERMVIVYRRGKEDRIVRERESLSGDDVLPEFCCNVADFFAMPGQ